MKKRKDDLNNNGRFLSETELQKMTVKNLKKLSSLIEEELQKRGVPWTLARIADIIERNIKDPGQLNEYLAMLADPNTRQPLLTIKNPEDILTALGLASI